MTTVLAVGRMQAVMDRVPAELRQRDFEVHGSIDDQQVLALARLHAIDGFVIGGGVSAEDRARLISAVRALHPAVTVIEPTGPTDAVPATLRAFPVT